MDRADTIFFIFLKVCTHISKEELSFTGIKSGLCLLRGPAVLFTLILFFLCQKYAM